MRSEGSSNGGHALPHRYQLSTCTANIRECESGSARRLALETRVLDGRAIGGWRVRPLADFPDIFTGTIHEKPGKWPEKSFIAATGALALSVWQSWSPSLALQVTGDFD
jgi:hypothetical protein